ncbi:DUF523 domain-containing protein [Clostridium fermenticellae]|uniref:DUF523 domain-containing protein n=1 Tax=Clostridium fermenticellae TaxID=2068654 RepID=A0A386H258_9CLOT|nr:DUF523 domain-containing protein [Clostridium fermenticellae]AYD39791.1 DUF523 domain-containing protein [Clostridium fermenticellae]
MVLVSACLCGINCKYNGKNNLDTEVMRTLDKEKIIPICPEQLGGLTTPRQPHEIKNGTGKDVLKGMARLISINGDNSTDKFIRGAFETYNICKNFNVSFAVLKSKSPSCGCGKIYDGTFSNTLIDGNGVTAQLLIDNNIKIINECDYRLRFNTDKL